MAESRLTVAEYIVCGLVSLPISCALSMLVLWCMGMLAGNG